jgi:magnesium transporter
MLGIACGSLVGGAAWFWQGNPRVAAVICGAILLAMITACLFGVVLPTTMRALKWDPRIAAGPIVLALGDVAALTFYFTIGARML